MPSGVRTCSIVVASYNTIMWLINWAIIGVYIHVFWKYNRIYAGLLLLHVFLSNAQMLSVFTNVSHMIMHDDDIESGYTEPENEMITIHRYTFRSPPPFWNEHRDPSKEV